MASADVEDGTADSKETQDVESEPLAKRQKKEKYNLRQKTLVTRIQTEERLVAPKQPKPKNRPPPLSKYRRKTANSRERGRMQEINTAFQELQTALPTQCVQATDGSNLTKITTLRLAVNYIAALRQVLGESGSAGDGPPAAGETCAQTTDAVVADSGHHGATDVVTDVVTDGAPNSLHGGGPVVEGGTVASKLEQPDRVVDIQQSSQETTERDQGNIQDSVPGAYTRCVFDSQGRTETSTCYRSRTHTEGTDTVHGINDVKRPESDLPPLTDVIFPIQHNVQHSVQRVNSCIDAVVDTDCSPLENGVPSCLGEQCCEAMTRPAPPYPYSTVGESAGGLIWSMPPYSQLPTYSDINPLTDVLTTNGEALASTPTSIFVNDDMAIITDDFLND
ncbi:uncharacterized protein LOC124140631 [Haliotis rufescens]|uniref:uncharacterized protein LOC124140631 n=1 Tax=Haliotis rufescens TaxID=6454 RepID=UPI001EAF9381|nr:uncharacterized protein LOC124140631 [Haliotis rufescens]